MALSDPSAGNLTPGLASPSHQQLPHMKGKKGGFGFGKGKGGKSKKGKGSGTTVRYHRGPGKERDPRGRASAAMRTCLRCGQNGHTTSDCPVPRSSANSPSKRPATSQSVESMAIGLETGMVIFQDVNGHERVDCTMLDPGASAFLCGYGPLRRYLGHLEQLGYPLEKIEFVKCCRTFHFGGDAASLSSWTVKLPVFINQKVGRIQAYLVKGETPMLLGRPIMESLGLLMDFHGQRIKFMDGVWQSPTRGRHGEYLLSLTCDYQPGTPVNRLDFDLVVPDDDVTTANEVVNYPDFMAEETAYETFDLPRQVPESEPGDRPLRRHQLRTMEVSLQTAEKALNAEITSSLHPLTGKRVLWEIYCGGSSRVAEMAEAYGMTVERFGLDTGWDFDDPAHRAELLRRLRDEAPDEVFLAPTCGPWSQMQNLNAKTLEQQEALHELRQWHHDVHLCFVKAIYLHQLDNGRHAHLEQPAFALSWKTQALRLLPGWWSMFDQCMYGCMCLHTDEGRGWLGEQFQNWTTDRMIEHLVAPGEAHERLGLVERRHSILRKAVEVYLHDLELSGPDGIKESLVYVVPQINNTANVAGFSPSQWVLGYQPHVPGDLLSDDLGPQHLDRNSSFEDSLSRRNAAKAALLDVDLDMKLRRALLRKYEGDNAVLQTGQLCHFWRDARATDLVKIRWHGPAKVMIREDGPDGRPAVYWLAFKTQLIRCAPHHVRPDFTNASQTLLGNLQEAKRHLRDLKSRGVTRYLDLNVSNRRNLDDIEDDEQEEAPMDFDGDIPPDDPDDPQEPPRQRRRLLPFPHLDSEETQMDFEYEPSIAPNLDLENELSIAPTSPAVPEDILDSPIEPGDPMLADAHLDLASVPASAPPQDSVPEPGIPTEPTTSTPPGQQFNLLLILPWLSSMHLLNLEKTSFELDGGWISKRLCPSDLFDRYLMPDLIPMLDLIYLLVTDLVDTLKNLMMACLVKSSRLRMWILLNFPMGGPFTPMDVST